MKEIKNLSESIRQDILNFLYEDELMNVLIIHKFENQRDDLGQVYVSYEKGQLDAVLHTKDDGNSYFTTYYAPSVESLQKIADLLKNFHLDKLLLAGPDHQVALIMNALDNKSDVYLNNYYLHQPDNKMPYDVEESFVLRKASSEDYEEVKNYMRDFFGAEDALSKDRIEKNLDLNNIWLMDHQNKTIGMGRFYGYSQKYIDITAVYINKASRGKGYSKTLMQLLLNETIKMNKQAILQTSLDNEAANKAYEAVGFKRVSGYAFQFLK